MLRISNIKIFKDISNQDVFEIAIEKNKIDKNDILDWHISKKSIDARKKDNVHYNYSIDIKVVNESRYKKLQKVKEFNLPNIKVKNSFSSRPVIVGAGPSGLFAALTLIENGIKPIIIEQGQTVELRKKSVDEFLSTGNLNIYSNVQLCNSE